MKHVNGWKRFSSSGSPGRKGYHRSNFPVIRQGNVHFIERVWISSYGDHGHFKDGRETIHIRKCQDGNWREN